MWGTFTNVPGKVAGTLRVPSSSHLAPRDEWADISCLPGRQECLPHVRLAERDGYTS
jgi:hypothetical protein